MISEYDGNSLIGITKVNDVRQYGSVVVKNLKILKIIQKPKFNKAKSGMVY
jgi:dTDP-glucose pyrophosphorylase